MDQEGSKIGTVNPHETSSNLLSSVKDEIMDTENPLLSVKDEKISTENPLSSGKDDVVGSENPPEMSSNSLSSAKDGIVDSANPTEVPSNPMALVKDNMMGTDNPPSSGKNDEMCTENPLEVSSNPPSGKDDMMSSENLPEVTSDYPTPGKDDGKKDDDSPEEGSSKSKLGDKQTPQSLKAKNKIVKKSQAVKLKAKKNSGSQQIRGRRITSSKEVVDNTESCHNADGKQISDVSGLKGSNDEPPKGKSEEAENKMRENENMSTGVKSPNEESEGSQLKDTNPPEGSSKPELIDKNTPQSLKAKTKIVKKSQAGNLKAKKKNGTKQFIGLRRIRTTKKVDNAESCRNADEKQTLDNSQLKETNDEPPKEKSQQAQKDKTSQLDKTEQKQKSKEKHRELSKGSRSIKNNDKRGGREKSQLKGEKGEQLGGFIFMCNAKTKPDCFRYRVMGVSAGKKDDVLRIKPGLKLFLYDFDLKLLYGIYKATSSGAMKLEPKAFGGKFPAHVRFKIASDCFPLPESIFRNAIKDNYNEKNKFRTELTVRQVRKLTQLFRPVGNHSAVQPVHSPSKVINVHPVHSQAKVIIRERGSSDGVRGSWSHLQRESYNIDRDRFDQPEEIARDLFRVDIPHDPFGMEGYTPSHLPRDRRNMATTSHVNPLLEFYEGDYQPHHLDRGYPRNVPAHVESLRTDPVYLNDSREDPYHAYRQAVSPQDAYLAPLSREEISPNSYLLGGRPFVGTDNLPRREAVQDRRYPIYSAPDALSDHHRMRPYHADKFEDSGPDALSDHHRIRPYHADKFEASRAPVSSRYTFAGPSFRR